MTKRLGIYGMTLMLVFALSGLALALDNNDRDRYHGGSLDARQHGYEHGYRDGAHRGFEDRDRNAGYDYQNDDYKNADRGYDKYMGDKDDYKKGYQRGYKEGYDDSYNGRSGRFGDIFGRGDPDREPHYDRDRHRDDRDDVYADRGWASSDVAYDIGYRDGVDDARKDLRKKRDYNPERHDEYKDADHGYRSSYGDKDAYKQKYRDGFRQGYQDGYGRSYR